MTDVTKHGVLDAWRARRMACATHGVLDRFRVTARVGSETMLAQIVEMVAQA